MSPVGEMFVRLDFAERIEELPKRRCCRNLTPSPTLSLLIG